MEPQIRYAKTSDGVNIAYWTLGTGLPLIHMPMIWTHVQLEWEIPECRRWYEHLTERGQLVRYDGRGAGLSQRETDDLSLEAWGRDVDAIVDRLGLERFAILGLQHYGPFAIKYAAEHPDRVSHVILWHGYIKADDWLRSPRSQAMREMVMNQDWDTYTEVAAHIFLGWAEGDQARRYAALIRQSINRETAFKFLPTLNELDVSDLLPAVRAPTLVMHRRDFGLVGVDVARELAAGIPDARLVLLDGESGAPYLGDVDAVASAIDEFLSDGAAPALVRPKIEVPSGMTAILFLDIVDSTPLTERLGDKAFRAKARDLDATLRKIIRDAGGTCIDAKTLGDGVLATFTSAAQAIETALACGRAGEEAGLPLHLGLHAGDVIREENNVFGGAVNIASRISGLSAPGEVLVSRTVADLARTSAGVSFEDRGEHALKGIAQSQRVFAVRKDASSGSG